MTLEFITGLLLVLAVLGTLVYILKELLSGVRPDFSKVSLSDALGRQRNTEPAPINQHLIGMAGEVVGLGDDSDRPIRVRLGSELWPARLDVEAGAADAAAVPAVGAAVVVTEVAGAVVIVRTS